MAIKRNPFTGKFIRVPTPAEVAAKMVKREQAAKYAAQVRQAAADRERRVQAHRNGYRGPVTRSELAAQVLKLR